jgi:phosphate transport system protein
MASQVEQQISESMRSLLERDVELARKVIGADADINRREVDVDELCRKILALRQPAASDLRLITTALKIVTDLERIGDLTVNIAERAQELAATQPLNSMADLLPLSSAAQEQVHRALQSFIKQDVVAAENVLRGDDLLDALFVKLFNNLLALMMEDSRTIRRATGLLSIAKHLERIGDHAMNIAEMVVYMVKGTDIRHPRSRRLQQPAP